MKHLFLTSLSILFLISNTFSQGACSNIKIESPVVSKPTEGNIVSATCYEFIVQWKGRADQTYIVRGSYKDPATNSTNELPPAINITCDNAFTCTATIPVTGGTLVSWNVQAMGIINDRSFYSYLFRGEQDYAVPGCVAAPIANPANVNAEKALLRNNDKMPDNDKMKVEVYPNPVRTTLNVNLNSVAKTNAGKVIIRIFDVNGKTVLVRQAALGNVQINVSRLSNGTYFINVQDGKGKVLHKAKFIKE